MASTRQHTYGTGSVYPIRKNGEIVGYAASHSHGTGPLRVRKTFKGKTPAEAQRKLSAYVAKLDGRAATASPQGNKARTTVAEHLTGWLDAEAARVADGDLKRSALTNYRMVVTNYLTPEIGAVRVDKLGRDDVAAMMAALAKRTSRRGKPLAPRTRGLALTVLRLALPGHPAVAAVDTTDPTAPRLRAPKGSHRAEHDALTDAEVTILREKMATHRLAPLFTFALGTGLREGEICGLRWSDVDLDAGTLSVRQTVQRVTGEGLVTDRPKTAASRRTIPLSEPMVDLLRSLPQTGLDRPVFPSTAGTYLDPTNVNHAWQTACTEAGIGARRFHATRHTYAVRYLRAGGDIYSLSSLLGHASIKITADTYADAIADAERAGVVAIAV